MHRLLLLLLLLLLLVMLPGDDGQEPAMHDAVTLMRVIGDYRLMP